MSVKNRKQIVVDANVGRGASDDKRFDPQAGSPGDHSRRCLQAFWEEEHVAVFSHRLRMEWNKHANAYARSWPSRMTRKDRILNEDGEPFSGLLASSSSCHETGAHKAALAKDFHLIQSALATSQLILSNETQFPSLVAVSCASVPELTALHFGNPTVEGEGCRLWIKAGAEKEPNRQIDVWAQNYLGDT